jgi:L-threonylcarbamoyladenylate synthase
MAGVPVPAAAVDPAQIDAALERLEAGQLVAFPTETVYGLGGDARNPAAIEAIFELKGRPRSHPVIVHVAPGTGLRAWAREIPAAAEVLIERFWPGPLTLVLLRASGVADALTGGQDTVALRCPAHPVALALLAGLAARHPGAGVAAPSANRFGRISPTRAEHVRDEFGSALMVLDGGPAQVGIESTILDLSRLSTLGPVLLRPGAIGAAELAEVLGMPIRARDARAPRISGNLAAHYAPLAPLRLVAASELLQVPVNVGVWSYSVTAPPDHNAWQRAPSDPLHYAHELYATLRGFDRLGVSAIWIEAPPEGPGWAAIADRLSRAAAGAPGAAGAAGGAADPGNALGA